MSTSSEKTLSSIGEEVTPSEYRQTNRLGKQVIFEVLSSEIEHLKAARKAQGSEFPKVGILIISYNASQLLRQTVERIPLGLLDIVEEIFIFDDASKDDTFEVGRELMKTSPWKDKLKVFKNPKNLGYGGNQKIGFRYGIERGLDYIVMLHGDGQYAPEHLPELISAVAIDRQPVVFGSRMVNRMDALKGGMPMYKWLGNQVLTTFENLILGIKLAEYHTGYRVYSTEVLNRIPFEENTNDFHFDSQIIVQVRALGAHIHEVPIKTFYGEEVCHVNGFKYAKDVCLTVLEYRLHQLHIIRRSRYFVERELVYTRKRSPYGSHEQLLKLVNHPGKTLDLSSPCGLLADDLRKKGAELVLVSNDEPGQMSDRGLQYRQHDLEHPESLKFSREFDFIVMSDVLAHIRTPQPLLTTVRKFLKPDGKILISVPNIALWFYRLSLVCGRFNYGNKGILARLNVHFYTVDTIRQLVERSGYIITKMQYTSLPFEVVFESSGKSRVIKMMDWFYYQLVRIWPRMFAYQIIVEAEIASFEAVDEEGLIK